jgi:lysyl-tRNA synthetase class 2
MTPNTSPDLWRPTAARAALEARAELLAAIRRFFAQRGVLEVETPLLANAGNSDPGIDQWPAGGRTWLRTSPEYAMKRLLAAGSGDIYELGRVFRGGEAGRHHNREFTLLEWYRTGLDYHELMGEVAELVRSCCRDRTLAEQRLSYRELFLSSTGIDPFTASVDGLAGFARSRNIDAPDLGPGQWLDLILALLIQPQLPDRTLTFVFDFPADQAALARVRPGSPPVAERFELFLGQVELANGYRELTDATEQRRRFEAENELRRARGDASVRLDENLLAALASGIPECSGVALGVDRLLMYQLGAESLQQVIPFPSARA